MSLRLCASCSRHVRDSLCPFCGATDSAPTPSPHSRSSRAAMVFGAASMVTAMACGGTTTGGDGGTPTPTPTETAVPAYGAPAPAYGAPAFDASPQPKDASPDSPIAPAYGAPPPDAGAVPPYGAPPPVDAGK